MDTAKRFQVFTDFADELRRKHTLKGAFDCLISKTSEYGFTRGCYLVSAYPSRGDLALDHRPVIYSNYPEKFKTAYKENKWYLCDETVVAVSNERALTEWESADTIFEKVKKGDDPAYKEESIKLDTAMRDVGMEFGLSMPFHMQHIVSKQNNKRYTAYASGMGLCARPGIQKAEFDQISGEIRRFLADLCWVFHSYVRSNINLSDQFDPLSDLEKSYLVGSSFGLERGELACMLFDPERKNTRTVPKYLTDQVDKLREAVQQKLAASSGQQALARALAYNIIPRRVHPGDMVLPISASVDAIRLLACGFTVKKAASIVDRAVSTLNKDFNLAVKKTDADNKGKLAISRASSSGILL